MHPFSIDYITREGEVVDKYGSQRNREEDREGYGGDTEGYEGDSEACRGDRESRHTPSPSDSGMGSDNSPDAEDQKTSDEKDSIDALLALDKKALVHSAPDVNGDKPTHSYIALISMAILSSPEKKMLLCDIYQYIMDNFSFYNNGDKAWRNSIRHNLSLNECFVKNGRADNGKGNYWSIHPACVRDFSKGDFRRRQARRRARKSIREPSNSTFSMPYRYNVGYVPMTASHISFHPYSTGSHSLLYPQSSLASISPSTHAHSQPSSSLLSNPSVSSSMYSHGNVTSHSLYPGSPTATPSQQSTISAISAAAVQRYFADETRVALAAQALAPQHLQTSIHFQNW